MCSDCLNRLPFAPTDGCCRRCGRAAERLDGEYLCEDCRTHRPCYDRAASALRRVGSPRRQGGLSEEDRRANVVGTFGCRRSFAGRDGGPGATVLVVDDIMTTGSTLSECARELKRAGTARVWCLTLARSLRT